MGLPDVVVALPWHSMTFRELPLIRGASDSEGGVTSSNYGILNDGLLRIQRYTIVLSGVYLFPECAWAAISFSHSPRLRDFNQGRVAMR